MTTLHLVVTPTRFRHRPTEIIAMQFTPSTRGALEAWLAAELGRAHFSMTDTSMVIETTQGDSRDCFLGDWVIRRPTRNGGFEFYPVEAEVIEDGYDVAEDGAA